MSWNTTSTEVQINIILCALPHTVELEATNLSGTYKMRWLHTWVPKLRLVSRSFSKLVTEQIVAISRCHVREARRSAEILVAAEESPQIITTIIDMFPVFILNGCEALLVSQSKLDLLFPSDRFDVSRFIKLKAVRLNTNTSAASMTTNHRLLASRIASPAQDRLIGRLHQAFRNFLERQTLSKLRFFTYDRDSHMFVCLLDCSPSELVPLEAVLHEFCAIDDRFCSDLMKMLSNDIHKISRATVQGIKDNTRLEVQYWNMAAGDLVPVSFFISA